jgi:hypothetical protein
MNIYRTEENSTRRLASSRKLQSLVKNFSNIKHESLAAATIKHFGIHRYKLCQFIFNLNDSRESDTRGDSDFSCRAPISPDDKEYF